MGGYGGGSGFTPSPNDVPGPTKVGSAVSDVHQMTGSVEIDGTLKLNGASITPGGGGGTSPGGSNTQVQYNNAGSFAGSANFTFDGNTIAVSDDADITANIGKATVGNGGLPNAAVFAHRDFNNANSYAFRQRTSTGQTDINAPNGQPITFQQNGANKAMFDANGNLGIGAAIASVNGRLHVSSSSDGDTILLLDGHAQAKPGLTVKDSGGDVFATINDVAQTLHPLKVAGTGSQQIWSYDGSNSATMTVNSDGDATIVATRDIILDPSGGDVFFERAGNRLRVEMSTGTCFLQNEVDNGNIGFKLNTEDGSIVELARFEAAGDGSLLMNGSVPIEFRDTATKIHSPASNYLAVTAPTLEVSGTLHISGAFGSTAIETLTSAGALSVTDGVSIIDTTGLANNALYNFTIPNGTFAGQQKVVYGKINAGASGPLSNAFQIGPSSNIDSGIGNVNGQLLLSGSDFGGGWQAMPRGGATLLWDGTKWITINFINFFWN